MTKRNYSRTPVTQTLKGNEKQFELSGSIVKFNLPCEKLIVTDFSALQCIVQCKSNLFHQKW